MRTSGAWAALLAAAPASAQTAREGFSLERVHAGATVEDGPARDLPSTLGHLRLSTSATVVHSTGPFVYRDAASGADLGEVVATRTGMELAAALGLGRRAEVALRLPATLAQSGDTIVAPTGEDLAVPRSFALGDPRVGGSLQLVGRPLRGFQLALAADAALPLGDDEALSGDGGLGGRARLHAAWASRVLVTAIGAGAALRPDREFGTAASGSEGLLDAGLYLRPHRRLVLSCELLAATAMGSRAFSGERSPIEAILGLRVSPVRGLWLGAAGGTGVGSAPGTPDLRLLGSVGFAPPRALRVKRTLRRRPPPEPEPEEVALEPEPTDEPPAPDEPAPPEPPAAPPADADGDGIAVDSDRCPDLAENRNEHEDEDGCPDDPRVEGGRIVRMGAIEFHEGTDRLRGASAGTLETVRTVLAANPWIRLVRIEGHTDDRGSAAGNREVSAQRARVVMRWLVEHGVEPERLVAQGVGADRPIADNATRAGRRANRRVEFHVVETGDAGRSDAPELERDPGF